MLLDFLCGFYDFTDCKPSSRGELMRAWEKASAKKDDPTFRKVFWSSPDMSAAARGNSQEPWASW